MKKKEEDNTMGLISIEEKNQIVELIRPPLQLKEMGIVRVFEYEYGGSDWSEIEICSGGVLLLTWNDKTKNFSFKIIDPESLEFLFVYQFYQNMKYDEESDYFHSFDGKHSRFGFLFSSVKQAKIFYQAVKNALSLQPEKETTETGKKIRSRRDSISVVSRVVRRFGSFLKTQPVDFVISDPSNFRQETHIGMEIFQNSIQKENSLPEMNNEENLNHFTLLLPNELISYIFSFLTDPGDLCSVSTVCTRWNLLANNDQLWKALYGITFGEEKLTLAQAALNMKRTKQISWKTLFIEQYQIRIPLEGNPEMEFLRRASVTGDLKTIKKIAKRYELDCALDSDGYTCLHYSSIHGHVECVKMILNTGTISVNKRVEEIYKHGSHTHGDTALHMACQHGHLEVVKILIAYGAEINIQGEDRRTPLHKAAMKGHLKIVIYLVENGASVVMKDRVGRHTPFDLARTFNQIEVMKYLKTCVHSEIDSSINE